MNQGNQNNQDSQNNQSNRNTQSNRSTQSFQNNQNSPITFLPKHGHYRNLRVYQVTEMIYDITFYFTQHFLVVGDRTIDQMVQAARSGKQNIAEGNQASLVSSETEIKLTNVAKASLEELLEDYMDYLRVRNISQWGIQHPRFERMRQYTRSEQIKRDYAEKIKIMNDEEIANLCITLIHQAIYMLHKLLITMQDRFVKEGGIKERMFQSRLKYRNNLQSDQGNRSTRSNQSTQSSQSSQSSQNAQSTQNTQSSQYPRE